MENLYEQSSREKLLAELRNFPEGLDEVYGRIVDRILSKNTDSSKADSVRLLEWLVCCKRPLKWYEFQGAVCINIEAEDGREIDCDDRRLYDGPKDLCGSLVKFHGDQTVEFVHPTCKEYLLKTKLVVRKDTEPRILDLTLGYLCLPSIVDTLADENSAEAPLLRGHFAYLEYAVACWSIHFQEAISWKPEREILNEILESLGVFLENHYHGSSSTLRVSQSLRDELKDFTSSTIFANLCEAVAWSRQQLGIRGQGAAEVETLTLLEIINRVRRRLESLAKTQLSEKERESLQGFYGANWYKCPRMNCLYFHQGFKTESMRQHHVDRHERPFVCIIEECDASLFGFPTKDALSSHMLEIHGIDTEGKLEFPEPPRKIIKTGESQGKHECHICLKTFTRGHNLKAHLRSHANEKPFSCEFCGMAFVRQQDKKRHEGTHSGEKQFVCFGNLKSGQTWGCNATFARQDKLADHFKSKTGQQCLRPLLKEQREEADENGRETDLGAEVAGIVGIDGQLLKGPQWLQHSSYIHTPNLATTLGPGFPISHVR